MSDEPKRRSRVWIVWVALAIAVLYPLSSGPLSWARIHTPLGSPTHHALERISLIYYPLFILSQHSETIRNALTSYDRWWMNL
jgi:hypothetical protein